MFDRRPFSEFFLVQAYFAEVHTEVESTFVEHLLDLGKRLLSEVAELHQIFLLILNEFAQAVDFGSLEAIERTYGKIEIFEGSFEDLTELERLLVYHILFLFLTLLESDIFVGDDHKVLDEDA
jgi:hypothetical protein